MSNLDTDRAIELIRSGNVAEGAKILSSVIQTFPEDEQAWLWMSVCVPDQEKKIYCLKRVLQINPENQPARKGLESYGAAPEPLPVVPPPPVVSEIPTETEGNGFTYSDLTAAMGDRSNEETKVSELTSAPEEEIVPIPENFEFENGPVLDKIPVEETEPYQPLDMDQLREEASTIGITPPVSEPVDDSKAVMLEDFGFDPGSPTEIEQPVPMVREEPVVETPRPVRRRRKTNWLFVIIAVMVILLLLVVLALKLTNTI